MLFLKRMTQPFVVKKCRVSGEMIIYGDYYYEDNEDGLIVKASIYRKYKQEAVEKNFDYSLYNQAASEADYRNMMEEAEKLFLQQTLMDRQIAKNGEIVDTGLGNV